MPNALHPALIEEFQSHAVWREIVARCEAERQKCLDLHLDKSDDRAAGKVRALEMVISLPDILLKEVKDGRSNKRYAVENILSFRKS